MTTLDSSSLLDSTTAELLFCVVVRAHILEDRSLKIERVRQSDDGVYTCNAENSVGSAEAQARLSVHCKLIDYRRRHEECNKNVTLHNGWRQLDNSICNLDYVLKGLCDGQFEQKHYYCVGQRI